MFIVRHKKGYCLSTTKNNVLAYIEPPTVIEEGNRQEVPLLKGGISQSIYQSNKDCVEINVEHIENGLFCIKRIWKNISKERRKIQVVFGVSPCFEVKKYLIPCVNVNGNEFGNGLEPKGLERDGEPWIFAYDRVSVPSCTLTENAEIALSLFASSSSEKSLISSCCIRKKKDNDQFVQEIYHPVIESPVRYSTRDGYREKYQDYIELDSGETFKTEMFIVLSHPRWENFGICKTLDVALHLFADQDLKLPNIRDVWDRSITFAKSLLSSYKDKKGFIIGFKLSEDRTFEQVSDPNFQLAWCGQNVLFSRMLIKDYILNETESSLQIALDVLDDRVKTCVSKNGLIAEQLRDSDDLENTNSDTCNLGYGAYEFLKTYELLKEIGIEKQEYLNAGLGVCEFFLTHFSEEYGFGKCWRHDGVCLDQGGSIGGFLIPAFAKAYELTKEEKYLSMAEKSMQFYMERDVNNFYCTAGALDTCCVDKETSAPFLMGAVLLYELTQKPIYLEYGSKAAYYFTSWMYHYQPYYKDNDEISRYNVTIRGLTAVSTQHHHVDMYAGIIVPYLRRLALYTGDNLWNLRAAIMWAAVLQNIGDGNLCIHGVVRPIGSQNEAIFHCNWAFKNGKRGDLNDWLVAWPCAFRLSVLAEML